MRPSPKLFSPARVASTRVRSLTTSGENAMRSSPNLFTALAIALAATGLAASGASAEENYDGWPILQRTFPSTGGGGIMIGEYNPVIAGNTCVTDFTATEPSGKVYYNIVEFDAIRAQGGT